MISTNKILVKTNLQTSVWVNSIITKLQANLLYQITPVNFVFLLVLQERVSLLQNHNKLFANTEKMTILLTEDVLAKFHAKNRDQRLKFDI